MKTLIIILTLTLSSLALSENQIETPYPPGGYDVNKYPYPDSISIEQEGHHCMVTVNYDCEKDVAVCYYYYSPDFDKKTDSQACLELLYTCRETYLNICPVEVEKTEPVFDV